MQYLPASSSNKVDFSLIAGQQRTHTTPATRRAETAMQRILDSLHIPEFGKVRRCAREHSLPVIHSIASYASILVKQKTDGTPVRKTTVCCSTCSDCTLYPAVGDLSP
jgi:hypothetical protein